MLKKQCLSSISWKSELYKSKFINIKKRRLLLYHREHFKRPMFKVYVVALIQNHSDGGLTYSVESFYVARSLANVCTFY